MTTKPDAAVHFTLESPKGSSGAVAVFRLESDDPDRICDLLGAPIPDPGAFALRRIVDHDDALIIRIDTNAVLVTPHGGPANTRAIASALTQRGATHTPNTDPRATFPEARDIHEARMLAALANGVSPRATDLLLKQPQRWRANPDTTDTAPDTLDLLLRDARIVVVGRENIGKSTLLNALAKQHVALAADHAGTTRDHVGVRLVIDDVHALWIDTPGVPKGATIPEQVAALLSAADLVIAAIDTAEPDPVELPPLPAPTLTVALRADRASAPPPAEVLTSVSQGTGIDPLASAVRRALVPDAVLADERPWRFWRD